MRSAPDFFVFPKWANAPTHAFGGPNSKGVVPAEDKESYWRIFDELDSAAKAAIATHADGDLLVLRRMNYS